MHALVIGGGIAGPVAAMALRRAGIDATVYEAHPTGAGGAGAFLTLGSNGIDALAAIGADAPALAAGFPTPGIVMYSGTGKRLGTFLASRPAGDGDGIVSHTLKRADLYQAINDEARRRAVPVEHGKRLVSAEQTPRGVRALFADGSEATGDLLIGADGVHSAVRRAIDPTAPAPRYVGLVGLGGYTSGVRLDTEPGTFRMIFGKRGFFGYAQEPGGDVWWFANVPRREEPARGEVEAIGAEVWRGRLARLFARDAGPAGRLIEASQELLPASPLHIMPSVPHWHSGRMVIIGDAAHAPSPSSGQGASLAVEDGVELAKCLRDGPGVHEAFAAYEALRRPRVERIAQQAARSNSNKTAGPMARIVRDALLPLFLRTVANSKHMQRTYGHHTDWEAPSPAGDRSLPRRSTTRG